MIGVGAIIIGRQHGREQLAGAVADIAQERPFGGLPGPISQHRNAAAAAQAALESTELKDQ